MAKSMRSKREKRLRAIRREIVEPLYQKKEEAKLAAQEAALNAPKLPVRETKTNTSAAMEIIATASNLNNNDMGMFLLLDSCGFIGFLVELIIGLSMVCISYRHTLLLMNEARKGLKVLILK